MMGLIEGKGEMLATDEKLIGSEKRVTSEKGEMGKG
jgi:hypothetical protein